MNNTNTTFLAGFEKSLYEGGDLYLYAVVLAIHVALGVTRRNLGGGWLGWVTFLAVALFATLNSRNVAISKHGMGYVLRMAVRANILDKPTIKWLERNVLDTVQPGVRVFVVYVMYLLYALFMSRKVGKSGGRGRADATPVPAPAPAPAPAAARPLPATGVTFHVDGGFQGGSILSTVHGNIVLGGGRPARPCGQRRVWLFDE